MGQAGLALGLLCLGGSAQAGSLVTINSNNVVVVNGTNVFGLAVSPGPPTYGHAPGGGDALDELRSGGILFHRMAFTGNWQISPGVLDPNLVATNQATLDWCAAHGIFTILNLKDISKYSATDTNTPVALKAAVDTFRNHSALGIWKNYDEAWWGNVSEADLQRGYDLIHQEDANHPVEQSNAPRGTVADLQPYNAADDITMIDNYPVVASGAANNPPITNTAVSQFGDWTHVLSQVANGHKNFWMIEQIAFSGTTPPPSSALIFPTFTQERFMAYQAIVNGARGLMFFGGNIAATLTNSTDAALGWNWTFWTNVLKPLTLQLSPGSPLLDALLVPDSQIPISFTGTVYPDIEFCAREAGTNLYLLATKRESSNAVSVTFSGLPLWATNGTVLFESNRTVTATAGAFTDSFSQWAVHAYRFNYSGTNPVITSQPQSSTNVIGTTASLFVGAMSPTPMTFQWRRNGANLSDGGNISGASSSKLSIANLMNSDAATYDVRIVGSITLTSAPAILTVVTAAPPVIVSQPNSRIDYLGTLVTFNVTATSSYPMTFQWRRNGTNLFDGGTIAGGVSSNLTIAALSSSDAGSYSVLVGNVGGTTVSSNALQTILSPGDTNRWRPMWSCAPGINPWATSTGGPNTPNERTIAYNYASNQLYVVQRSGSRPTIYVLNATNGAFLYNLNTNGYSYTGNIPLCGIAVADDGAIYACNNDTAGTGTPALKVYRWANSDPGTAPQLVYSGDPLGGVNGRWGDALDARGSGLNTVLLTDDHQPNATNPSLVPDIFVLQPNGSMNTFTGKVYALDQNNNPPFNSSIGQTLQFDPSGTNFWFKHWDQALAKNSYNSSAPNGSAATFLASYTSFPATAGPATQLFSKKLLTLLDFSGITGSSPDQIELYDFSNPFSPVLIGSCQFPANAVTNANRIGQIIMTSNYVFAIDANNGLLALQLITPPFILTNMALVNNHFQFDVLGQSNLTAIIQASSNLVNWLPLATNTLTPIHFSDPATPRPAVRYYRALLPGQ
ncbi:MAG: hypothetical protein C5B50_25915 [Verrucomicrobia bacterium]|nr:MAG: hypothetical protein C5B50_25915 [Verrucomicrobiota bacterium]